MLQLGGPNPLLHQILRPAAVVRNILGVVAIQRDAKAGYAVPQRLAMLAGRDRSRRSNAARCRPAARWISASFVALDGKAGKIPQSRPAAAFGPLDQEHATAAADEHGRLGNLFELRPRLGTGDLVLQPA